MPKKNNITSHLIYPLTKATIFAVAEPQTSTNEDVAVAAII